jgi:hypothetical protein
MIFKELFCRHKDLDFLGNVYGDLIDVVSTYKQINRSAWRCKRCGKFIYKEIFGDIAHESYNDYLHRIGFSNLGEWSKKS